MHMMWHIAIVPPTNVDTVFEDLQKYADECSNPVLDYSEDNYVDCHPRVGRREPRFSLPWWNVHGRTLNSDLRTNNRTEAVLSRALFLTSDNMALHQYTLRSTKGA